MHSQVSLDRYRYGRFSAANPSSGPVVGTLVAISRIGVLGVICAAPWWFGGFQYNVQVWLYGGLLISLAVWLAAAALQSLTGGITAVPLPAVLVPVIAALLLGSFQVWPEDTSFIGRDPTTSSERGNVETQTGDALSTRDMLSSPSAARSIYPFATRVEMARLSMAIVAVFLGCVLFSSAESQLWLWTCLALNGAALAFFGIAQQLSWNGKLFGTVTLSHGGQPFASYVNRNNAAGYLNLCLAAAIGLVFWRLIRAQHKTWDGPHGARPPVVPGSRFFDVKNLDGTQLGVLAILTLIATGIVCSLSRGGTLAMTVATLAVCGMSIRRWSGLRITALLMGLVLLCGGLLVWTGLEGHVKDRWQDNSLAGDGRLTHWRSSLAAARDFPVVGTGFGTYRFAYLPYQTWPASGHFNNADNQFMEGLVEGGLVGLGLILLAIGLSLAACLALARALPADPVAAVGLFAVISQCVSSFFDFGPTLAANMLTFALMVGAITGRAARYIEVGSISRWLALPALRPAWLIVLVGMALLTHGSFGLRQVSAAADSQSLLKEFPRLSTADSMSEASLESAIGRLQAVVTRQPDDAEAQHALGRLWIFRYQLQTHKSMIAVFGFRDVNWKLTDPANLYARVQEWHRNGEQERIAELQEIPQVRDNLVPALKHLNAARSACPGKSEVDLQLATLAFLEHANEPAGEEHLHRAVLISPGDADLLARCGALANAARLTDFAYSCWRRSLELDPVRLAQIRPLWKGQLSLEDELQLILPDSPELLLSLAEKSYAGEEHRAERDALIKKAQHLLDTDSSHSTTTERLHVLARCSVLRHEPAAATRYYEQLLLEEPLHINWRLELVDLLRQQGDFRAALDQAELCLAMAPEQSAIRKQVNSLRQHHLRQSSVAVDRSESTHTP